MIPVIGLIIGIVIGFNFIPFEISYEYSNYVAVAILGALDSVFGGIVASMHKKFNTKVFVSGFIGNAILGAFLAFIGDKLAMPLYLAAIFAFGNRLFLNFAIMRRQMIDKYWPDDEVSVPESEPEIDGVQAAVVNPVPTNININISTTGDSDASITTNVTDNSAN